MKYRILLMAIIFCSLRHPAWGQVGEWTWVNGSTMSDPTQNFGTQGVEAATNEPPGLYEPAVWTDTAGNFWLFAGVDQDDGVWGDMWRFNPLTNYWTWINGTGTENAAGNYGTMGVPSSSNLPPSRGWGISCWMDKNGDLWLYGGEGEDGQYSDLWRYNIASNMWTWMQGSNTGGVAPVYGTLGVESPDNTPGERQECDATWIDSAGNFWLYGGQAADGNYCDLWRYNPVTNYWTWMGGTSEIDVDPVYGVLGVPSPSNTPGSRWVHCSWKDANGNFWLSGGEYSASETENDMWMYNLSTGNWTWMGGSNMFDSPGNYGTQCVSDSGLSGSSRFENRATWTDDCGNFWFFGGCQLGTGATMLNDLWYFNPVSLKWTFVNGVNGVGGPPVYGTMGVAAPDNNPGGRMGSVGWRSKSGQLYMFGGSVNGWLDAYNDVWEFIVDPTCGTLGTPPSVNLGNDTSYCGAFSRTLTASTANAVWSTGDTGMQITVTQPGEYWVTVTGCGSILTDSVAIGVLNLGNPFYFGPDTTYCAASFSRVLTTGYANSVWSTGDTGSQITVSAPGVYWATISNNCGTLADTIRIEQNNVTVQAGPISSTCGQSNGVATIVITTGNPPFTYQWEGGGTTDSLTGLSPGIYKFTVTDRAGCTASDSDLVNSQAPSVTLMSSSTNICPGDSATICAPSGYASYLWNDGEGTQCITATLAGNYYVTVIDNSGCTAASDNIQLNVLSPPPVIINITGDTLRAFNSTTYQWYYDGVAIPGDTTSVIIARNAGSYSVAVSDTNGCLIMSNNINITGINNLAEATSLKVYPDPATDELNISYQLASATNLQLCITDIIGRRITDILNEEELSGNYLQRVNIRNLASAVYILTFTTESGSVNVRFVKE